MLIDLIKQEPEGRAESCENFSHADGERLLKTNQAVARAKNHRAKKFAVHLRLFVSCYVMQVRRLLRSA